MQRLEKTAWAQKHAYTWLKRDSSKPIYVERKQRY